MDFNFKSFQSLKAGDHVWAYNPSCQHLHSGIILTHFKEKNTYAIKFNKPDLGSLKLPEYYISSTFIKSKDLSFPSSHSLQPHIFNTENIDFRSLATFKWFIDFKK